MKTNDIKLAVTNMWRSRTVMDSVYKIWQFALKEGNQIVFNAISQLPGDLVQEIYWETEDYLESQRHNERDVVCAHVYEGHRKELVPCVEVPKVWVEELLQYLSEIGVTRPPEHPKISLDGDGLEYFEES